jgi:phospholipid/cholesterol/gamma-HCH transport system substrate-binding protein
MAHRGRGFAGGRIRVALLTGVGLLLLAYGVFRVGKIFDVFASRYTIVTFVQDVAGLREGAPVTLAGQRVGQVSLIEFIDVREKRDQNNLRVELAINHEVRDQIRRDSRVYIRAQGLLGDKYIDITPGSANSQVLAENEVIRSEPTMDIEAFLARGGAIMDSASRAVADVKQITMRLVRGEGTMGQLLTNDQLYARLLVTTSELQGTLAQFNRPDGTFGRMLRDPTMYNRLVTAISRIDTLGNAIMNGQGTIGRLIHSDSLYRGIFGGVTRADSTLANFSGFLTRMTTGQGTFQRLATDPRLYDELLKAIVDMQLVIAEMRQDPKRFMPPVQVRVF